MWAGFTFFPTQASTLASRVDSLFFYLVAVTIFFTALIFALVTFFAVRYRRRQADEQPQPVHADMRLELAWSIIPLAIALSFFVWGASIFFSSSRPPSDALDVRVVGKQWMWKVQHPQGKREINELHVPLGRAVKLTLTSEDVIHSFYVPAFRLKKDVFPGRYTTMWFEPTKLGSYHLFCAEYCGTEHSRMIGRVVVMEPSRYDQWLEGGGASEPPAVAGERLVAGLGCLTCHGPGALARAPSFHGVFGKPVELDTGQSVIADESYLRESILNPGAKLVKGYQRIMPTYQGQLSEEEILNIIAYIKSLAAADGQAQRL